MALPEVGWLPCLGETGTQLASSDHRVQLHMFDICPGRGGLPGMFTGTVNDSEQVQPGMTVVAGE